jgi:6,7-dimethyl-8-ribityllumazine synthase
MTGSKSSNLSFDASRARVAIVAARFNAGLVDQLIEGATRAFLAHGGAADSLLVTRVPGAFELPLAALKFAASGEYQAVIALGCVIRGDTPHFDYVAGECAAGISRVMADTGVPVGFGVLTVDTLEQAIDRAGGKLGNKGAEAALAAIEMAQLLQRLEE